MTAPATAASGRAPGPPPRAPAGRSGAERGRGCPRSPPAGGPGCGGSGVPQASPAARSGPAPLTARLCSALPSSPARSRRSAHGWAESGRKSAPSPFALAWPALSSFLQPGLAEGLLPGAAPAPLSPLPGGASRPLPTERERLLPPSSAPGRARIPARHPQGTAGRCSLCAPPLRSRTGCERPCSSQTSFVQDLPETRLELPLPVL